MNSLQHLIHIGFPKSGSTFLKEWFMKHPAICLKTRDSILGYDNLQNFLDEFKNHKISSYDYLVSSSEEIVLSSPNAGNLRPSFGLPNYNFSEKSNPEPTCNILKKLFPNSKILIITRGYRGAYKSFYKQYIKIGGIKSPQEIYSQIQEQLNIFKKLSKSNNEDQVIKSIINKSFAT